MRIALPELLVAFTLGGCVKTPKQQPTVTSQARRHIVVSGLDVTGSYAALFDPAKAQLSGLIQMAPPGTTWYARTVSDHSYSDRCIIATLEMPAVSSDKIGVFNERASSQRTQVLDHLRRLRSDFAVETSKTSTKIKEQHTDIYSFLRKAATLLGDYPDADRSIVLESDMEDDSNFSSTNLNLAGVRVYVVNFMSDKIQLVVGAVIFMVALIVFCKKRINFYLPREKL